MTVRRNLAGPAALALGLLLSPVCAAPAQAHGAPQDPVSRALACGPQGGPRTGSPACRAARAASGQPIQDWDNLRLPGVAGRDRQVIPDGKLCSAGIPRFRGLDLPRADWPATPLRSGAAFTCATGRPSRTPARSGSTSPLPAIGRPSRWPGPTWSRSRW